MHAYACMMHIVCSFYFILILTVNVWWQKKYTSMMHIVALFILIILIIVYLHLGLNIFLIF